MPIAIVGRNWHFHFAYLAILIFFFFIEWQCASINIKKYFKKYIFVISCLCEHLKQTLSIVSKYTLIYFDISLFWTLLYKMQSSAFQCLIHFQCSNYFLPPWHVNWSDCRLTLSWQPQVLPEGVGKQNVLQNPFLFEQLVLTNENT